MPRVTMEMLEGRTLEEKRVLAQEIGEMVREIFKVPPENVLLRFVDVKFEDFASGGELRSDASSREGKPVYGGLLEPRLTVQYVEGRTMEQLRVFVERVTNTVAKILNIPKEGIIVYMIEMKRGQLSQGGMFLCDK